MTIIQVALTAGVIFLGLYMYIRLRSTIVDVLLIFLFVVAGVFLVLFNEYSDKIAHWFGVGRGADLIFYTGFLFLFFLVLKLYARIRKMEQNLTELVRKKSIEEAENIAKENN